jgi:hypothetical protein
VGSLGSETCGLSLPANMAHPGTLRIRLKIASATMPRPLATSHGNTEDVVALFDPRLSTCDFGMAVTCCGSRFYINVPRMPSILVSVLGSAPGGQLCATMSVFISAL